MKARPIGLAASVAGLLAAGMTAAWAIDWGSFPAPTLASPEVIGSYNLGCLAGGVALPIDGPGYQVMRLSRNRYYGHPDLIRFIENLAAGLAAEGHPGLLIGDLAQARGGPMRSGHASHQVGLDVDIWFVPAPSVPLAAAARESLSATSMVSGSGVDLSVNDAWGPWQVEALRMAASSPEVDRIFVNPAIKRALCDGGNGGWLRKIRPWWGHDAHFHVRLACPSDQPACVPQAPLPAGDGCDASLDWWFSAEAAEELAKRSKPVAPREMTLDDMPAACTGVYYAE